MKKKTVVVNVRDLRAGTMSAHNVRVTVFENVAEAVAKLGEAEALKLLNYAHSLQIRAKKFQAVRKEK